MLAPVLGPGGVAFFARDPQAARDVWSRQVGYPGDPAYRDFHTYDHPSGLKPSRVTGKQVPPDAKRPSIT